MDIPTKKRRTEEVTDYKKCVICQTDTTEPLDKNISIDAYKNILFYVFNRGKYGESKFAERKRLEGLSENDLKQNSTSFHGSCRKTTVSLEKLRRAQNRFEKAVASKDVAVLSRAPGRPSLESKSCLQLKPDDTTDVPQWISRTFTATYNKEICFFCQTHGEKQSVHTIRSENRGKQLCDFVKNCGNEFYKIYLSSAINPEDALTINVKYHRTCWTKHVRAAESNPQHEASDKQESEIAANRVLEFD